MKSDNLKDLNEDLYEHFKLKVDKGQDPLRIDKFIINRIESTSRNRIQLAAKNGFIFVDGEQFFMELENPLEVYHYKLNTHFNALGYRLLAEDLFKKILYNK